MAFLSEDFGVFGALVDVFEASNITDFEWREGSVEGGEFVDLPSLESWTTEDGTEGEITSGVGPGVDTFVKFIADDFSFEGEAIFIHGEPFGGAGGVVSDGDVVPFVFRDPGDGFDANTIVGPIAEDACGQETILGA